MSQLPHRSLHSNLAVTSSTATDFIANSAPVPPASANPLLQQSSQLPTTMPPNEAALFPSAGALLASMLANRHLRNSIPSQHPPDSIHALRASAVAMMNNIWADSTWGQRVSLHRRLTQFICNNITHLGPNPDSQLDWAIVLFVESTQTTVQTKLTYVKTLAALFRRTSGDLLPICSMYSTALRSSGAIIPVHQALPASPEHVDNLLARSSTLPRQVAAIFLLWKTASRWDEISRITGAAIRRAQPEEIVIEWLDRTKTSRADPYKSSTWTVVHHFAPMTEIAATLRALRPEELLINMTTQQLATFLRADVQTSHLTAHSFKRGALTQLMRHVSMKRLSPEIVPRLAKHKSAFEALPATTIRYASSDPVSTARALGTQEATVLLECNPRPPHSRVPRFQNPEPWQLEDLSDSLFLLEIPVELEVLMEDDWQPPELQQLMQPRQTPAVASSSLRSAPTQPALSTLQHLLL